MAGVASASPPDDLVGRGTVLAAHLERSGPEPVAVIPPDPAAPDDDQPNRDGPSGEPSSPADAGSAVADPLVTTDQPPNDAPDSAVSEDAAEPQLSPADADEPPHLAPEPGAGAISAAGDAVVTAPEAGPATDAPTGGGTVDAEPVATTT